MGPVVLVIGDISFYHDMNGFWASARHQLDVTVVLVNNNGGGIFHYLPQAAHEDIFEEWFGTPPDLDFSLAARMYGGGYTLANDWTTFRRAVTGSERGLRVVEVRTDRQQNTAMHKQAWAAAARAAWSETVAGGAR
jgi:2-succinyl-5-enolpyruvyl-6-hydroxy-3-cyclohexene-1-carboxylate synthase